MKVLDVGCGKGSASVFFAEKFGCSVTGLDITEDLLEKAKWAVEKRNLQDKVEFKQADATSLPFENETFDRTIFQAVLFFVKDEDRALSETKRVLKKSGSVGAVEPSWKEDPPSDVMIRACSCICIEMLDVPTYDGWENLFRGAGFEDVKTTKLGAPASRR